MQRTEISQAARAMNAARKTRARDGEEEDDE